jgi:glycosyltransferase involved in cell wall biosynthesis
MTGYSGKYQRNGVLDEFGLSDLKGKKIIGLFGWIQSNKKWDFVLENLDYIMDGIDKRGGNSKEWVLLAAGQLRDPASHQTAHDKYMKLLSPLEEKGLAKFYEFTPRNEAYYKAMSLADVVVLPSVDETQSGTLARIIALNKPYVTFNLEGLGLQTAESQGGLLATDEETLADRIIDLAVDSEKRQALSENQANYLRNRVSWEVVGGLYLRSYELARNAVGNGGKVVISKGDPLFHGHF